MGTDSRREDIFVSVCVADVLTESADLTELTNLSQRLAVLYRYYEILIVATADSDYEGHKALLRRVANVRLMVLRPGTPFYRRRATVASEAIGDIVVLAAIDELPTLDVVEMIELVRSTGTVVFGRRSASTSTLLNPLLRALGASGGFRVDTRDMLTACYPRPLLNKILAHPDRQLALRFLPADAGIPVTLHPRREGQASSRSFREMGRRLAIVQKLLVSSAPRVLTIVSGASMLVVVAGTSFAGYAIVAWFLLDRIQPGWFTTALVLSLTAAFLGGAIFGLTIGLQKVIEALSGDVSDDVVDELGNVDMFGQAMKELNVELSIDHAESADTADSFKPRGAA